MPLIVEDGTVVPSADSFLSLADARALAANYGVTLPDDDTEAEVNLRVGYNLLLNYESTLTGSRVSANQTGIYPREGGYLNCFELANDTIPEQAKLAQLYGAGAVTSGYDINNIDTGEKLTSFELVGVIKETYADGSASTSGTITGVESSLNGLTKVYTTSVCGISISGGAGGLVVMKGYS